MDLSIRKKLQRLLKQSYPKNVYVDIYTILKNSRHTSNDNGFFFNLSDIPDNDINKCIEYIEHIQYNIEDHIKNMNIRENTENMFKSKLSEFSKKLPPNQKNKNTKEKITVEKPLITKKIYKGVYKRLDRVVKGLKKEEIKETRKKKQKKEQIEENEDNEEKFSDEENLFGSECSEEIEDLQDVFIDEEDYEEENEKEI